MSRLWLIVFTGCFSTMLFAESLEIASYNVHNLFDAKPDKGKNDYEFLPSDSKIYQDYHHERCKNPQSDWDVRACKNPRHKNWTDKKVELKLSQIKRVFDARRTLPNLLALTEVENEGVTRRLADTLGYKKLVITDGPDERGIDVALLFNESRRLKKISSREVIVPIKEGRPTRPILEVKFLLKHKNISRNLFVYVNHWPSQHAPNSYPRMVAAKTLRLLMEKRMKEDSNALLIATGDFNTTKNGPKDIPHPFRQELLKNSKILDVQSVYEQAKTLGKIHGQNDTKGTYYYGRGKVWNYLDRFFISSNLLDEKGVEVDLEEYEVFSPSFITRTYVHRDRLSGKVIGKEKRTPKGYRHHELKANKAGFSDHFPIFISLKY